MVRFLKFLLLSLFIFLIFSINVNAEEIEASNETTPGEQVTVEETEKQDTSETEAVPTEPAIEESKVLEYDTMIEGDMDTVFVVTNSYYGTGGDVPPSENPKTADSIYTYISMLLISLMGLTIFTKSYVKNNL